MSLHSLFTRTAFAVLGPLLVLVAAQSSSRPGFPCAGDNGGLTLPEGFCATAFATDLGSVRHLAVSPSGDLYAAIDGGRTGVLGFRDTDGDGKPEQRVSLAPGHINDVAVHAGYLYAARDDRVLRWRLTPGKLQPDLTEETIVSGLPEDGDHAAKTIAFGGDNVLYVKIGSASNSCQKANRLPGSRGQDPCSELERHAGIWAFTADRPDQQFKDGKRFATGMRNAEALAIQPATGALYAAIHGRDQLSENWGFSDQVNADDPAEELVQVNAGDDFGWPYCYYSNVTHAKVLAPEYGGDGKQVGRCASAKAPLLTFPGHWGPMSLAFYPSDAFGPKYQGGLFVAFHGSWNRAPLPQAGYRVVFVPFENDRPKGTYATFATGGSPTSLRAVGLAVGKDGSLFISGDRNGTIWKVSRRPAEARG